MKIVMLDMFLLTDGDIGWEKFQAMGDLTLYAGTPADLTAERIGDAEVVLSNRVAITRDVLERCPNVKYIGLFATGFNLVDIDAARERGIPVTNVPGYSGPAVAQHALALLLALCNRVKEYDDEVKKGRWSFAEGSCFWDYSLVELSGLTLGLVGYGTIGRAMGKIGEALGMRVLAYRRRRDERADGAVRYVGLDELIQESDVVSLHAPLNDATREIINRESLARMKDGVFLINTARGALVSESAVAEALASGKLAGYATDATAEEPVPAGNPLLTAPNCIITPHIAWAPLATRKRLFRQVEDNLRAYLDGAPINVVNP